MNRSTVYRSFAGARDTLLRNREDYASACREFRWPCFEYFNWALDYFDPMAEGNSAVALWIVEEDGSQQRLTFDELRRRSAAVANGLRRRGVRRGDRVLLMMGNERPLWEAMLGCIKLGAVVVPASTLLSQSDLRDRFERGGVRHAIVNAALADKFDELGGGFTRIATSGRRDGWLSIEDSYAEPEVLAADGETRASDPLLLYFTSGTTSRPKLVLHTHQSYPVGHLSTMYWIGLRPGDTHLNISSPGWAKHAWSCFFAPWNAQACVFIYNQARFKARALLDVLAKCEVTSLCAPPTVWRMLIQEDLAAYAPRLRLRELVSAGEPLNPEVIAQVRTAWGLTIRDGFGQTETTAQIGNPPGQPLVPGSMGRPLPGYTIELLDAEGKSAAEGEVSIRLEPRPLGVMPGYEGDAERTREVMRNGFYRTGDIARRDEEGYITYVGRADDVFKSSDYRISPFELESVLIEHPAVAEAAIVPSPDALRLAVPKAFVTLRQGHVADADLARSIFAFLNERLAPYKRVRRIEFADLPKTVSGKIRRVQLRALEAQRRAGGERGALEFLEEELLSTAARPKTV